MGTPVGQRIVGERGEWHDARGHGSPKKKSATPEGCARVLPAVSGLELAAEGELDALLVVTVLRLGADRHGEVDDQRTDRRLPLQGDTGGGPQVAGLEGLVVAEGVADVDERGHARGVDILE